MEQDIAVDAAQRLGERNLEPGEIFRDRQTIFSLQGNRHESAFRAADVIAYNVRPQILRNPPDVALCEPTRWTVRVSRFHAVRPRTIISPRALAHVVFPDLGNPTHTINCFDVVFTILSLYSKLPVSALFTNIS